MLLRFYIWLLRIIPYFLGLVFVSPPSAGNFPAYIERYAFFVILFVAWDFMQWVVVRFHWKDSAVKVWSKSANYGRYVLLIVSSILVLLALNLFKVHFIDTHFYVVMATMACSGLALSGTRRGWNGLALLGHVFFITGVAYLSFKIASLDTEVPSIRTEWQPALLGFGFAVMATSARLASWLSYWTEDGAARVEIESTSFTKPAQPKIGERHFRAYSRLYALFVFLGPLSVAALSYAGQLSPRYVLIFVIVPLVLPLLTTIRLAETSRKLPLMFLREACGLAVLYVTILLILRLSDVY